MLLLLYEGAVGAFGNINNSVTVLRHRSYSVFLFMHI